MSRPWTWQEFVAQHCRYACREHVAAVVGQPVEAVGRIMSSGATARRRREDALDFGQLFTLWHGRPPRGEEWPAPRRQRKGAEARAYEWLTPELVLLGSLVGRMAPPQICEVLTQRLRDITGDPEALRDRNAVQIAMNRMGLQVADVVGGIIASAAGREIGSYGSVLSAINTGALTHFRVGRHVVIPHEAWAQWKVARPQPPADYVRLAVVFKQLGITSDSKPQEFAPHIETARQYYPFGERGGTSRRGVWFVHEPVARRLIADRRAGRPMPWHGKPIVGNLKMAWARLVERAHPGSCPACCKIWGKQGRPRSFEDFSVRYPPLSMGDKRHLTRPWNPGLTVKELADEVSLSTTSVLLAIANGTLPATKLGRSHFITRADATLWKGRGRPDGNGKGSWISLATAERSYGFDAAELQRLIREYKLKTKSGIRGRVLVPRNQCAVLRKKAGYSEREAARKCGVPITRFRLLLRGLDLPRRAGQGYPIDVIRNVQRRINIPPGLTIAEAAAKVRKTSTWVRRQVALGLIEVIRAKWDHKKHYVTEANLRKLKKLARAKKRLKHELKGDWLLLSEAGRRAGVSIGTIRLWAREGALQQRRDRAGVRRYRQRGVEVRARQYWSDPQRRPSRRRAPRWLQRETEA